MPAVKPYKPELDTHYQQRIYSPFSSQRGKVSHGWVLIEDSNNEFYGELAEANTDFIVTTPFAYFVPEEKKEKSIKDTFDELKGKWKSEVRFSSDPEERVSNENYRKIIDLRFDVVPYLLQDLKDNHTHWFDALSEIIGVNPIKEEHSGNIPEMVNDWIEWSNNNLFSIK